MTTINLYHSLKQTKITIFLMVIYKSNCYSAFKYSYGNESVFCSVMYCSIEGSKIFAQAAITQSNIHHISKANFSNL